jgi:hypothetical protein
MHIEFYFIRHAFSYGNAIRKLGGIFAPLHKLYMDPPLTQYGKETSSSFEKNNKNNTIDIVFSSTLLRSIETALFMFPQSTIYLAPHLNENAFGLDNWTSPVNKHMSILGDDFRRVSYKYVLNNEQLITPSPTNPFEFLMWFETNFNQIMDDVKSNNNITTTNNNTTTTTTDTITNHNTIIKVAIVTHAYFILEYLGLRDHIPKNNAIYKQIFYYPTFVPLTSPTLHFEGYDPPSLEQFQQLECRHVNKELVLSSFKSWFLYFVLGLGKETQNLNSQ